MEEHKTKHEKNLSRESTSLKGLKHFLSPMYEFQRKSSYNSNKSQSLSKYCEPFLFSRDVNHLK